MASEVYVVVKITKSKKKGTISRVILVTNSKSESIKTIIDECSEKIDKDLDIAGQKYDIQLNTESKGPEEVWEEITTLLSKNKKTKKHCKEDGYYSDDMVCFYLQYIMDENVIISSSAEEAKENNSDYPETIDIWYSLYSFDKGVYEEASLTEDDKSTLVDSLRELDSSLASGATTFLHPLGDSEIHLTIQLENVSTDYTLADVIEELSMQLEDGLGYKGFSLPDQKSPILIDTDTYSINPEISEEIMNSNREESKVSSIGAQVISPPAKMDKKKSEKHEEIQMTIIATDTSTGSFHHTQIKSTALVSELKKELGSKLSKPSKGMKLYFVRSPLAVETLGLKPGPNDIEYPDKRVGFLMEDDRKKIYEYGLSKPQEFVNIVLPQK